MSELVLKNKLPKGWIQIPLSEISTINPKPEKNSIDDNLEVSFIPMKCVEELSGKIELSNTRKFYEVKKGFTYFKNNDIIFAKITPCMENGKIAITRDLKNGIGYGSTEFHVIRLHPKVSREFYFHYLIRDEFRKKAGSKMKGTAGQLRVPVGILAEEIIPLPPLNEQKKIVIKIEELFSLIDQIIKLLKVNKNKIHTFKNTFLNEEFNKKWIRRTLEDITKSIRDGTHNPPTRTENGIPLLSAKNIQNGFIYWGENCQKISKLDFYQITKNNSIEKNNVLLTIVGTLGRSCVVETSIPFTVQRSVAILKFKEGIIPTFVKYFFDSLEFQNNLKKNAKGVAQVGVYLNTLKKFEIPIPNYVEQQITIARIQKSFSFIEKYIEINEFLLSFLSNLKISILKNAFEGKLVPQDPNDEPAQILLEKIKQEKQKIISQTKQ